MRGTSAINNLIIELRKDVQKHLFPNVEMLTQEQQEQVDHKLTEMVKKYFANEQPSYDPKEVIKVIKEAAPHVDLVPTEEIENRKKLREKAAEAYGESRAFEVSSPEGKPRIIERSIASIYLGLSQDKQRRFMEFYDRAQSKFYANSGLSKQEINRAIGENKKQYFQMLLERIIEVVDNYQDVFTNGLSDEDLINRYSEIYKICLTIYEVENITKQVDDFEFDNILPGKIARYRQINDTLMTNAVKFQKRMAILADPFYPYIEMEKLWDGNASTVDALFYNASEYIVEKEIPEKPFSVAEFLQSKEWKDLYEDEKKPAKEDVKEEAKEEPKEEPKEENKEQKNEPVKFGEGMDCKENIFGITFDISFTREQEIINKLAQMCGMGSVEVKEQTTCYDKNGNVVKWKSAIRDMINDDEEFFVVPRYGNLKPIAVMRDQTKPESPVMMGADEIATGGDLEVPQPPRKLSLFAKIKNGISEFLNYGKTAEKIAYDTAKAEYDRIVQYNEMRHQLAEGRLPKAIEDIEAKNKALCASYDKEKVQRRKNISDNLIEIGKLSDVVYDNDTFDNLLADLLVDKAMNDPSNSVLHILMLDSFKPFSENYNEDTMRNALKNLDSFHEFAHNLRTNHPKLVEKLMSSERFIEHPKKALDDVAVLFYQNYVASRDIFTANVSSKYAVFTEEKKQFLSFEKRLNELNAEGEFAQVAAAAKKVFREGTVESKRLLASLNDGVLYNLNGYLEKNPDTNFEELLNTTLNNQTQNQKDVNEVQVVQQAGERQAENQPPQIGPMESI